MNLEERMREAIVETIRVAAIRMPPDVEIALAEALAKERKVVARKMLKAILDNARVAREENIPICQDTGSMIFNVEVGVNFPLLSSLKQVLLDAVREATKKVPLRVNVLHPLTGEFYEDNVGLNAPWILWNLSQGSSLKITLLLKGGGSEATSKVIVLTPAEGLEGAIRTVLETVSNYGPNICPPIIVGIGIGGVSAQASVLAIKSLIRPLGTRSLDPRIAKLEVALLELLNKLEIGPFAMGGRTTALDVHVEIAARHPASYPVAMCISCWALRRASLTFHEDGTYEITQAGEVIVSNT